MGRGGVEYVRADSDLRENGKVVQRPAFGESGSLDCCEQTEQLQGVYQSTQR